MEDISRLSKDGSFQEISPVEENAEDFDEPVSPPFLRRVAGEISQHSEALRLKASKLLDAVPGLKTPKGVLPSQGEPKSTAKFLSDLIVRVRYNVAKGALQLADKLDATEERTKAFNQRVEAYVSQRTLQAYGEQQKPLPNPHASKVFESHKDKPLPQPPKPIVAKPIAGRPLPAPPKPQVKVPQELHFVPREQLPPPSARAKKISEEPPPLPARPQPVKPKVESKKPPQEEPVKVEPPAKPLPKPVAGVDPTLADALKLRNLKLTSQDIDPDDAW